ncbi:hypothetical protein [Rhizobium rhizogenes]|uniref:hypothetical protein n=1 Tax=Rhizobium rhizogenes TaxID=359 RepID=UPI00226DD64E|nr:hypothetical protein [Rhizobium rhizogenes]
MANVATEQLPLPSLVRAAAWDAGNRSMSKGGRKVWNRADYNAAARFQNETIAKCFGEGPTGFIKFGIAEAMQNAGVLTLDMKAKDFFQAIDNAFEANARAMAA